MYSSGTPTRIALAILGVQSADFALFYYIRKCTYSSGTPTRIALAILGVQSAGFALFYWIGNCSYSSGTPTRIALAILGVQTLALHFYWIGNCMYSSGILTGNALTTLGVKSYGFALYYIIGKCLYCNGMPIKTIAGIQFVEFEIVSAEISGILSENLSYSIKCFYIMFCEYGSI